MKNLASLFIIIVASFTQPAAAQNVVLQTETLNTCLNEDDRVDRLSCYDSLFERPADPAPLLTSPIPVANPNGFRPPRARELEALLQSSAITDEGVAVTVLSTATGERMFTDPNTFMTDITARQTQSDSETFRRGHDVYLAIPTLPNAGEQGALIISCENNITHMRTLWQTQHNNNVVRTRVLFGETFTDAERRLEIRMRVRAGGYVLLAPRGLESIRVLSRATAGQRLQITTGETADDLRSLFFDVEPLRAALPLVARHCSWSVQTFRREF